MLMPALPCPALPCLDLPAALQHAEVYNTGVEFFTHNKVPFTLGRWDAQLCSRAATRACRQLLCYAMPHSLCATRDHLRLYACMHPSTHPAERRGSRHVTCWHCVCVACPHLRIRAGLPAGPYACRLWQLPLAEEVAYTPRPWRVKLGVAITRTKVACASGLLSCFGQKRAARK